jgi:hypothetical protein
MIDKNPQEFFKLLEQAGGSGGGSGLLPGASNPGGPIGAGGQGAGQITVTLTAQEQQIIEQVRIYFT